MLKRAELARALVVKPEILFMDEPFSALDALMNLRMRNELLRILAEERRRRCCASCTTVSEPAMPVLHDLHDGSDPAMPVLHGQQAVSDPAGPVHARGHGGSHPAMPVLHQSHRQYRSRRSGATASAPPCRGPARPASCPPDDRCQSGRRRLVPECG